MILLSRSAARMVPYRRKNYPENSQGTLHKSDILRVWKFLVNPFP